MNHISCNFPVGRSRMGMQLTEVWLLCQLVTKCDICSSAHTDEALEVAPDLG